MLMKIRKNNLLTITVLTSATGHHMAVFGVYTYFLFLMIPCGSDGKESACNVGDLGSIPVLGRSPGEGKVYPLQYSCLENSMVIGAWWATVPVVAKSPTQPNN